MALSPPSRPARPWPSWLAPAVAHDASKAPLAKKRGDCSRRWRWILRLGWYLEDGLPGLVSDWRGSPPCVRHNYKAIFFWKDQLGWLCDHLGNREETPFWGTWGMFQGSGGIFLESSIITCQPLVFSGICRGWKSLLMYVSCMWGLFHKPMK